MTAGWTGCPNGRSARGGCAECGPSPWRIRGAATLTCCRFGIGTATASRCIREAVAVMAALVPTLDEVMGTPRLTAYADDAYQGPGRVLPVFPSGTAASSGGGSGTTAPMPRSGASVSGPWRPSSGRNRRSVRKWALSHRQARGGRTSVHPSGGSGSSDGSTPCCGGRTNRGHIYPEWRLREIWAPRLRGRSPKGGRPD